MLLVDVHDPVEITFTSFPNARYVVNGFQGAAFKDGEHAGLCVQNGWPNSVLPWSAKANADKNYRLNK